MGTLKKFRVYIKNKGDPDSSMWHETYTKDEDPEEYGRKAVDYWNASIRPHEKARVFIRAELIDDDVPAVEHQWEKQNAMTRERNGRMFDILKCRVCGITAKRYGVNHVMADSQYRAKVYRICSTAKAHLAKKANKLENN